MPSKSLRIADAASDHPIDADLPLVAFSDQSDYGISVKKLNEVASDIDRNGFAVIENFLTATEVHEIQDFITKEVEAGGNQYLGLIGRDAISHSPLATVSDAPAFNNALRRLYELGAQKKAPKQGLYQVVRCLKGESGKVHSFYFHYDSYLVTALIPIHIPAEGQTGDLVISINRRPLRSSYLLNVIDKLLINNTLAQKLLKTFSQKGQLGFKRVKMVPGNIYFFWGCRTIHANEPCDIDHIRATALFHFGDPYADSGLRKYTGKAKYRAKAEGPVAG